MNKILNRIAANIGWIISGFLLILNLFLIGNARQLIEKVDISFENIFVILGSIIGSFILFYVVSKIGNGIEKKSKKVKIIIVTFLLLIYASISILWVNYMQVLPTADSKYLYDISSLISQHRTNEVPNFLLGYMSLYPHQLGLIMIFTVIFKITHSTSTIMLQVLNVLCNVVTLTFMYLIVKKFLKEYKPNLGIYWWLSLTFLPLIFLTTYIYGDYIGLMFTTVGIFYVMKFAENEKYRYLIISAIAIALSIIAKKNYCITMIAVVIYLILNLLSKKRTKKDVLIKSSIVICFAIAVMLPEILVTKYSMKKIGLKQNITVHASTYMAMGMNENEERGCGWFDSDIMNHSAQNTDILDTDPYNSNFIKGRIKDFIKNPKEFFRFYGRKIASMWVEPTYQSIWYNHPRYVYESGDELVNLMASNKFKSSFFTGTISNIVVHYQKAMIISIFAGITIFVFKKRKEISNNAILLVIVLIGGFCFHLIWEAKGRYVMPYVILSIPIATVGLSMIYNKLNEKINTKIINNKKIEK